ncbi:MAG: hypothetical protein ACYDGR_07240 [Candidatus Dormibacteria bacterium]
MNWRHEQNYNGSRRWATRIEWLPLHYIGGECFICHRGSDLQLPHSTYALAPAELELPDVPLEVHVECVAAWERLRGDGRVLLEQRLLSYIAGFGELPRGRRILVPTETAALATVRRTPWRIEAGWERREKDRSWVPSSYQPGLCVVCDQEADLRRADTTFMLSPEDCTMPNAPVEVHVHCLRVGKDEYQAMRQRVDDRACAAVVVWACFSKGRRFEVPANLVEQAVASR